ncbi:hypothetical protein QTP88_008333 [Uroleucon formosanum]
MFSTFGFGPNEKDRSAAAVTPADGGYGGEILLFFRDCITVPDSTRGRRKCLICLFAVTTRRRLTNLISTRITCRENSVRDCCSLHESQMTAMVRDSRGRGVTPANDDGRVILLISN